MQTELDYLSVRQLSRGIANRDFSPTEVVQHLLNRIDQHDSALNSHITVCADQALQAAAAAERVLATGEATGPLFGIPFSAKDNIWTKGVRTTAHSKSLLNFVPDRDATVIARLKDAGMILLGKTNTNELACGLMEIFGEASNPWDTRFSTAGSSTGSAVATAAGLTAVALGTDTGGSIRTPASFCGVAGLTATYGRVSRSGVIPLSWTQDYAGPIARTVEDVALLLGAMSGYDAQDPTTSTQPVLDFTAQLDVGVTGMVIGVPEAHFYDGLDPEVDLAVRKALRQFEAMGARLEPVTFKRAGTLRTISDLVVMVEAFAAHAGKLRTAGRDYGDRPRQRMGSGAFYTAAEYLQAQQLRQLWITEMDQVMTKVDLLVTPTVPMPPFVREVWRYAPPDTGWNTRPFNLSGHPALTLPCGFTTTGLPVGMQLVGRYFDEATLFRVGHAFQQQTDWHQRRPPIAAGSHPVVIPTPTDPQALPGDQMAALRQEADRQGLPLDDQDLAVIGGAVARTRAALATIRPDQTESLEPPLRFTTD